MLSWNVYYYNCNRRQIEVCDIFEHGCFQNELKELVIKYKTKEEFAERLKSILLYYFWSRAEYEVIVAPWVGGDRERDAKKIDIYQQIMNNWHVFLPYVWDNMLELIKDEEDES